MADEKDSAIEFGEEAPAKLVKISIREFALPCPRTGSIDSYSGYGASSQEGIEIHQIIQKKRASEHKNYESEVKLSRSFVRGGYEFVVEGRIDGLFTGNAPKIEEIKSTFNTWELTKVLQGSGERHPYGLQLLTYGYFYLLENGVLPELSFHLVSTRNREATDLDFPFDRLAYETWLELRLNELVQEAIRSEKRTERRQKIQKKFPFPFEKPRRGQVELIQSIEEGMAENKRMLVQAPTGLGKTAGVLYPTLKEALGRGQRVIYVTPKNSQHSVAEDAVEKFQETGSALKSLTLTAKSKLCFKAEPLCNPNYCEYAKDYYDKVAEHGLIEKLAKKKKLSAKTFQDMGEKYQVCPFELQLDGAAEADVVICDYNYVFSPRSAFRRANQPTFAMEGNPNLVIDEAHNLPSRATGYYSPSLSSYILERMREGLQDLPKRFATEAELLLDECIGVLVSCKPDGASRAVPIDPPTSPFLEQDGKLRSFLSRYLDSDVDIKPKDPVLSLCFYWGEFTGILDEISGLDRKEFFTTFQPDRTGGIVKITCCDASEMLKPRYDDFNQVVGFSATLKPFEFYSQLSGLAGEKLKTAEFESPFEKSKRKLLIIPQISTKFSDRERNYARIAETISRISALKKGNHLAFFPSFDFMERVLTMLEIPEGFTLMKQERYMRNIDTDFILQELKGQAKPILLFAVQGGVFSEGVDYPGEMVVGAFVVGPPLPTFDLERETMKKYYEENYKEGFSYAYTYPAMAKAIQSAGRVIRSETDRGVIVLMDGRFIDPGYSKSMPRDWFTESPHELVSKSILKDISDFWALDAAESASEIPSAL